MVITTMEQEVYVKVDILENKIEAQLLDSILNERNIPHHIQSYYDTAFDGLFQIQKGWGYVSCPRLWSEEIEIILSEIRQSAEQGDESFKESININRGLRDVH